MTTVATQSQTGGEVAQTLQFVASAALQNLPSSVAASGSVSGNLIQTNGYKVIAAAITSTQAGTLQVQRYLDAAGTIAQGAALSVTLSAATPAVLNSNDGVPFQSLKVTVTNSSASAATLSGAYLMLQSA